MKFIKSSINLLNKNIRDEVFAFTFFIKLNFVYAAINTNIGLNMESIFWSRARTSPPPLHHTTSFAAKGDHLPSHKHDEWSRPLHFTSLPTHKHLTDQLGASNLSAEFQNLDMDSNSNQVVAQDPSPAQTSNQAANGDGSHTVITGMDADVYKAAAKGNIEVLEKISDHDLLVHLTPKHNTILHIAAQFGQLECVNLILRLPSSSSLLQHPNLKGDIPLHLAAREGHFKVLKALLDAAKTLPTDIETGLEADKLMLRMTNKEKDTALHEAVRYGEYPHQYSLVELLIEKDPEYTYGANVSGGTPLYMAAERGFPGIVKIILDKSHKTRTSPAYSGFMGRTALHAAVLCNDQGSMLIIRRV